MRRAKLAMAAACVLGVIGARPAMLSPGRPGGVARAADATDDEQGAALIGQKKYAEAEAAYRRAVKDRPNDGGAWLRLGRALMAQKKYNEAAPVMRHAAELSEAKAAALQENLPPAASAAGARPVGRPVSPAVEPAKPAGVAALAQPAATRPAAAAPAGAAIGPLKVGDAVEVSIGGNWNAGTVTYAEGLTYFVHMDDDKTFRGRFDKFRQLPELRKPRAGQTLAEQYHDVTPDPEGGPIAIGQEVEYAKPSNWIKWRVARRIGQRYVLFPEDARAAAGATDAWAGPDEMRAVGSKKPFGAKPPAKPRNPTKVDEVHVGDQIEAYRPGGYGWSGMTVLAIDHGRYYVQSGGGAASGDWVVPVNMRAVGTETRFEEENLGQFVGTWLLTGDAFFTTAKSVDKGDHTEKTMELNSGAGRDAGRVTINADGTYVVTKTAVFHDDAPGNWVRNPKESEGGILLKDGDREGKDLLVTPYHGGIYLQGWLRGPGKVGEKK